MLTKREFEMEALEEVKTCRHFNGIQHDKCKAGVTYHDLASGTGCALRYPCLSHDGVDREKFPLVSCPSRSTWTKEEAELNIREREEWYDRAMVAIQKVHADAKEKGLGKAPKRKGGNSQMKCPVCPEGVIGYSVASSNGHIHARCSTKDCISFME